MASKKDFKIMENLIKMAEDIDGAANARIFSVLYCGNKIISYGYNQDKTHPFQDKWKKNEHAQFWHAETNAIFNALKRFSVEELQSMNLKLYVARVKHNNDTKELVWGLAAPCEGCRKCIKFYKINKVFYSQDGENGEKDIGEWLPTK